jgi:putative flippase GtrA
MATNLVYGQFVRYVVVGVVSNLLCYLVYLGLNEAGLGHKLAMSILYAVGVAQTFAFNRRWTFKHDSAFSSSFYRYCALYGAGYLLNLLVLYWLVDLQGFPHQIVQGVMILALAVLLFLGQKFWVFRSDTGSAIT